MRVFFRSLAALLLLTSPVVHAEPLDDSFARITAEDTPETIIRKAAEVTPHARQLAWQRLQLTCFVHFGVNTFTDREWGSGREDPAVFDPTELDAEQWVLAAKSAGMKLMLLTAKHHDGFCLWPTRFTAHSVASSPWKDGDGDVVREVADACQKYGLKFGVYLSPADLYQIESEGGYYGNGSEPRPTMIPGPEFEGATGAPVWQGALDDYNRYFMNQLYELLTEYGRIDEVWFDGANPKPGTGQEYDYDAWFTLIRRLAPDAVIAIGGPDVRWCGNEAGHGRENEWSVVPLHGDPESPPRDGWWKGKGPTTAELGSRELLMDADFLHWYPSEVDTSIRPGWFYHASQDDRVKSLPHLLDIYYDSVGGNAVLLLNIPPDHRGMFHENDVRRLAAFGAYIRHAFDDDLALGAAVRVEQGQPSNADHLTDGDESTFWIGRDGDETAALVVTFDGPRSFNQAMLQEHIETGQRIESFELDAWKDGTWQTFATGSVVGYKKLLRFEQLTTDRVRIRITGSRICPTLSRFGVFDAPLLIGLPRITRSRSGEVTITPSAPGPVLHYTLDGTVPTARSPRYTGPFAFEGPGLVRAVAIHPTTQATSAIAQQQFGVSKRTWSVHRAVVAHDSFPAVYAIDDNPSTMWHTPWGAGSPPHPHTLEVDLGLEQDVYGFTYLPRTDGHISGAILRYDLLVSRSGTDWEPLIEDGEFGNIANNPVEQYVWFDAPRRVRYIAIRSRAEVKGDGWVSMAEFGILTTPRPE